MKREAIDFNKELLIGEIGAVAGTQIAAILTSQVTSKTATISLSAVIGAIAGAVIFWLATRIYDKKKKKDFSVNKLANDIAYFTPAALLLTLVVYYPSLYFLSNYLLSIGDKVVYSVFISQAIAFILFLIGINIYRIILIKIKGKEL